MALQSDGRIIAGGYSDVDAQNTKAFAFTRYHSDVTARVEDVKSSVFDVYPNPVSTILNVNVTIPTSKIHYAIFSIWGQAVLKDSINATQPINVTGLLPGNYIISFFDESGNHLSSKHFFKQ